MNQTRSVAGCQSDMETVRQIAFYDSRSDDRQADGWHHPESNLGDRHWYSHVTLPQTVTAGHWVMDGLRGRHGKYKTATVFLVPVTDTPTMTPFSLMDCHIIPYEDVFLTLSCAAAKRVQPETPVFSLDIYLCMTWEICLLLFFLLGNKWKRNVFVLDEKNCFSNRKLLRPSAEMSGLTRVFLQYPSQVFKTSQSVVSQAQSPTAGTQTVRRNSDLKAVKVNVASCCEIPDGSLTEPCLPLHVSVYNCTSNSLQPAQRCRSTWWKGSLQQKRTKPQQDKVTLAHTGKHIHLNLFKSHWWLNLFPWDHLKRRKLSELLWCDVKSPNKYLLVDQEFVNILTTAKKHH